MKKITVITPTYNRAYTLDICYNSLCNQTNLDFSWLVIDDGSTDNTENLVNQYKNERKISIDYIKKKNGGKASALNLALDIINTDYCVCLDSDEYFANNAIEIALKYLNEIQENEKICGILALRRDKTGKVLGGKEIPSGVEDIKYVDIYDTYNIVSEVICFYKTSIVNKFRFPVFNGENFVSPAYIQYEITRKFMFKVFRDPIIFCEYLNDGLTRNKRKVILNNPYGYLAVKKQSFIYSKHFRKKVKHGIMYGAVSMLTKDKYFIRNSPNKILLFILLPLSYIVYKIKFDLIKTRSN